MSIILAKFMMTVLVVSGPGLEGDDFWAWQPKGDPAVPDVDEVAWCRTPIDHFVLARLEAAGLRPAPEADRLSLVRRAAFDLTGLPPDEETRRAYLEDREPGAHARMVDRLLESPRYGERWARHWLDVVRYAETNGFERDTMKPEVWRYRDWVIRSLNQDMPYDRFILEQIAGDELPDRDAGSVAATGMHRLGLWDDEPTDVPQAIADDLDSIVDTTVRATLGMSIGCARCHDHKGDPISQADYYAMTAFFSGVTPYRNPTGGTHIAETHILRSMPRDPFAEPHESRMHRFQQQRTELVEALRAQEAASTTPTPAPGAIDGLVAAYRFEQGDPAADLLGKRDGRVTGVPGTVPGRDGGALACGADRGHLEIERPVGDDFTVSFFMRTEERGLGVDEDPRWFLGSGIVDGEVPGIVRDFGISLVGDGVIAAGIGAPERFIASPPGFNDGSWHHVALVRDRSEGRFALYVDGVLADRGNCNRETLDAQATLFVGRSRAGGGPFEGEVDELRFHDRALSHDEVISLATGLGGDPDATAAGLPGAESTYLAGRERLRALSIPRTETVRVLSLSEFGPEAPETRILGRGSVHAPGEVVEPDVPEVVRGLAPLGRASPTVHGDSSGRRTVLANWINHPDNALALRTAVNRIWHHHFGRGLVPSTNDLGRLGLPPSHPELIDWLATEFLERGRSLKSMHRLIMNSSTYRMSSTPSPAALELDPENRLLSRYRLRRLGAEEIRDAMLTASGELLDEMGGPSVRPPMPDAVLETSSRPDAVWPVTSERDVGRRSIYVHTKRSLLDPLLTVFDLADPDSPCPERHATTQPTQGLTLLNSRFANDRARAFARRVARERPRDLPGQLRRAIEIATCRPAEEVELEEGLQFVEWLVEEERYDRMKALEHFCLVALNLNEFLHVD